MFTICVAFAGPPPAPNRVTATLGSFFSDERSSEIADWHLLDAWTQGEYNTSEDILHGGAAGYVNSYAEWFVTIEISTHSVNFKERMIDCCSRGLSPETKRWKRSCDPYWSETWLQRRTVQLFPEYVCPADEILGIPLSVALRPEYRRDRRSIL